jgi:hypothetical protein
MTEKIYYISRISIFNDNTNCEAIAEVDELSH